MKKLTKSAKIILISAISVICVFAIVLGAILANRRGPSNPLNPDNDKNNIQIITKADDNINLFTSAPYAGICESDDVVLLGANYFIFKDSKNVKHLAVFKQSGDGFKVDVLTSDKFNFVKEGAKEFSVVAYNDSYAVIKSTFDSTSEIYKNETFSVVYYGGDTPVEVYQISTNSECNLHTDSIYLSNEFLIFQRQTLKDYALQLISLDLICVKLDKATRVNEYIELLKNLEVSTSGGSKFDVEVVGEKYITYILDNEFGFFYFLGSNLKNFKCEFEKLNTYKFFVISDSKYILFTNEDKNENYYIINYSNDNFEKVQYNFSEGFSSIYNILNTNQNYYMICESNEDNNNFLYKYFDMNSELILKYNSKYSDDSIMYLYNDKFCTKNAVYEKTENEKEYILKLDFFENNLEFNLCDENVLSVYDINLNTFKIYEMNKNFKEIENDYSINKVFSLKNNKLLFQDFDNEKYYIFDTQSKQFLILDNIYIDENTEFLMSNGYYILNTNENAYNLYFSNSKLCSFDNYVENDVEFGKIVKFYLNNKLVLIISFNNDYFYSFNSNNINQIVAPYSWWTDYTETAKIMDTSGNVRGTITVVTHEISGGYHNIEYTIIMNKGYRLNNATITVNYANDVNHKITDNGDSEGTWKYEKNETFKDKSFKWDDNGNRRYYIYHVDAYYWDAAAVPKDVKTNAVKIMYTITLDKDGGSGGTTTRYVYWDDKIAKITIPKKDGYTFLGYFSDDGTMYINDKGEGCQNWNKSGQFSYTLYARWDPHKYTVSLQIDEPGNSIPVYANLDGKKAPYSYSNTKFYLRYNDGLYLDEACTNKISNFSSYFPQTYPYKCSGFKNNYNSYYAIRYDGFIYTTNIAKKDSEDRNVVFIVTWSGRSFSINFVYGQKQVKDDGFEGFTSSSSSYYEKIYKSSDISIINEVSWYWTAKYTYSKTFSFTMDQDLTLNKLDTLYNSNEYSNFFKYRKNYLRDNDNTNAPFSYEPVGWLISYTSGNSNYDYVYYYKDKDELGNNIEKGLYTISGSSIGKQKVSNDVFFDKLAENKNLSGSISVYALYEPKPYNIYVEAESVSGGTPKYDANGVKLNQNNFHLNNFDALYEYKIAKNTDNLTNLSLNSTYNIGMGNTLHAEIRLKAKYNENNSSSNTVLEKEVYSFGRLEFTDFPYKTGGVYKKTNLIFLFSISGYDLIVYKYYTSEDGLNEDNLKVNFDESTGVYSVGDGGYNLIKFNNGTCSDLLNIEITNCNLAMILPENPNEEKVKTISDDTVRSTGSLGFGIKAYAVPNNRIFNKNETKPTGTRNVLYDLKVTGNYNSINGSKSGNTYNPYFVVSVIPKSASSAYVWVNGRPCEITTGLEPKNGNNNEYAEKGYKSCLTQFTLQAPWNESSEKEIPCNIYIDGLYGYIISDYSTENDFYALPNFGNTGFYALEPWQEEVTASANNATLSETKFYELKSYLSSITINDFQFNVEHSNNFTQPTKFNKDNKFQYFDTIQGFANDEPVSPFNETDHIFEYQGVSYTILGTKFLQGKYNSEDYSFYLYLGVDSKGKYMYFLVFTGSDKLNRLFTSTGSISVEFKDISNKIDITIKKDKDDDYDEFKEELNNVVPGATIEEATDSNGGAINKNLRNLDFATSDHSEYKYTKLNVFPTNSFLYKITPQSGFIISKITLRINNLYIIYFELNENGFCSSTGFSSDADKEFSLLQAVHNSGHIDYKVQIGYDKNDNIGYAYTNFVSRNLTTGVAGIYYSTNTQNGSNTWVTGTNNGDNFDSLFVYISNIYDDVTIEVETKSYFELVFYDSEVSTNSNFFGNTESVIIDDQNTANLAYLNRSLEKNITDDSKVNSKFALAYYNNGTLKGVDESIFDDNGSRKKIIVYCGTDSSNIKCYRIVFFGLADVFRSGIAFMASGTDYSYSFSDARYYKNAYTMQNGVQTPINAFDNIDTKTQDLSSLRKLNKNGNDYKDEFVYIFVNGMQTNNGSERPTGFKDFFDKGKDNYSVEDGFIFSYKYAFVSKISENKNTLVSQSWLSGSDPFGDSNSTYVNGYQVDNPTTKVDTWFNDTTVTNIYYLLNGKTIDTSKSNWFNSVDNWQNYSSSGELRYDNSNFGYGIYLRYYIVPGYYLEKIKISSLAGSGKIFGTDLSLNASSYYFGTDGQFTFSVGAGSEKSDSSNKFNYKFIYGNDNKNGSYYDIYLYLDSDSKLESTDFQNNVKNLGMLASSIKIDVYSSQYTYRIVYNGNTGISSSKDSLKISGASEYKNPENGNISYYYTDVTYDRMTSLSAVLSMPGYTFIGWGSETYDGSNPRYYEDGQYLKWNSSSYWFDIIGSNQKYFDYQNRNKLMKVNGTGSNSISGYDFYVDNSYFITDTGFSGIGGNNTRVDGITERTQSYNFWSAYSRLFTENMISNSPPNFAEKKRIDLYAIWKANTYYVGLNLNDGLTSPNDAGKSTVQFAKLVGDINKYTGFYEWNLAGSSVILPGNLSNYLTYKETTDGASSMLSCYITFDTDDWYVLTRSGTTSEQFYISPYSAEKKEIGGERKVNLRDYVIDRYGYTWLGWFSKELNRVFDKQDYYQAQKDNNGNYIYPTVEMNRSNSDPYTIYGTSYYGIQNSFIKLNYENYVNKFTGNVKEITSSHFTYKDETIISIDNIKSVSTSSLPTFDSNGNLNVGDELKTVTSKHYKKKYSFDNSLNFIYFYNYKESKKNINGRSYNTASDTLNTYNKNAVDEFTPVYKTDDDKNGKPKTFTKISKDQEKSEIEFYYIYGQLYYDTMIDYSYYNYVDTTNYFNENFKYDQTKTYRYLTLYAYWQTNSYNVVVDFRDANSRASSLGQAFGSTSVTTAKDAAGNELLFMPVYFDDGDFEIQISRFLPIRLGYDFVGWSFGPTIKDSDIVFTKSESYSFESSSGNDWQNKLYKVSGLQLFVNGKLTSQFDDKNNKEQLGDNIFAVGDDNKEEHYIYIFAVWQAQTYSINVSLNISDKQLKNLYDLDSEFALSLYSTTQDSKYIGLNSRFAMSNTSSSLTDITYNEIVANIVFEITFDEMLSSATLINIYDGQNRLKIKDLFATSAGYYFLGWLSRPEKIQDEESGAVIQFVTNNTLPSFGLDGKLVSGAGRDFSGEYMLNDETFNETLFKKLYASYLKPTYTENVNDTTLNFKYNVDANDATKTTLTNYETDKLENIDYTVSGGRHQEYTIISNNGYTYYTTIGSSSNASTNFGYITKAGRNFYISSEMSGTLGSSRYYLYYMDATSTINVAKKYYLFPYVRLAESTSTGYKEYVYIGNSATNVDGTQKTRFTYDGTNFYIDGYLVRFYDKQSTFADGSVNAYYVDSSYDKAKSVSIKFMYSEDKADPNINADNKVSIFTLKRTREFTLYAKWDLKTDLVATVSNGNNDGDIAERNNGLAGYYKIYDEYHQNTVTSSNQSEKGIQTTYDFYNDLDLLIAPYYNGRFMSEISIKFYSYEDVGNSSTAYKTNYQKVTYELVLGFSWVSSMHNIKLSSVKISRNGGVAIDISSLFSNSNSFTDDNLNNIINLNTSRSELLGKESGKGKEASKLSLINKDLLYNDSDSGSGLLFEISRYIDKVLNFNELTTINFDTIREADEGRIDSNYVVMNLGNVMTNVDITCKFSVQTYKLEVYNVFDTKGNTFESVSSSGKYMTKSYATLQELILNSKSAYSSDGNLSFSLADSTFKDSLSATGSSSIRLATISQDSAKKVDEFNVPYGCYIYGQYYNQQTRPVDVAYNKSDRTGYDTSIYTGYDYIYDYGYYTYGSSGTTISNQNGIAKSSQGYTILGSKTLFSNSVREASALYTFVSWFVPSYEENSGIVSLVFNEYNINMERTSFRKDVCLIGYYYANNKPTSINFYTWNDNTNSYEQYTNNIDEYTLQSTTNKLSFITESTSCELGPAQGDLQYSEANGQMILLTNESFGVDVAKFGVQKSDLYTNLEIPIGTKSGKEFEANQNFIKDNLIRDYWFYKRYKAYLYIGTEETPEDQRMYIYYDDSGDSLTSYYYTDGNGKRQYVQLFSDNLEETNFAVYAHLVSTSADKISIDKSTFADKKSSMIQLSVYKDYFYDFAGSQMYVYLKKTTNANDMDKYYKLKKIEDYESDYDNGNGELTLEQKETIESLIDSEGKFRARFYTLIGGQIYFMVIPELKLNNVVKFFTYGKEADGSSDVESFHDARTLNNSLEKGNEIVNIDNYFLKVENDFYEVEYRKYKDGKNGSTYISPYEHRSALETNVCEYNGKTIYFNYANKTFYDDYAFTTKTTEKVIGNSFKVYTPVNSNYTVIIGTQNGSANLSYLGVNINTLPSPNIGFWYNNNTYGYIGYIALTDGDIQYIANPSTDGSFAYTQYKNGSNTYDNERIYDVLVKYIDTLYTGKYSAKVIAEMKNLAAKYCEGYNIDVMSKSLITVGNFYTTDVGTGDARVTNNIVTGVCILIPATLELNFECDGKTIKETLTVSVKYHIDVISDSTSIEGTIYAIPIYSRNVVEFTNSSVTGAGSMINIDVNQMNSIYFETVSNMYTHYYNSNNGQDLKFVVLNETQYSMLVGSSNYPDMLTYLLKEYNINPANQVSVLDNAVQVDFSRFGEGRYYVVAYYEKEDKDYVIRTSDNVIQVEFSGGMATYSIIESK